MTITEWLAAASRQLTDANIGTARLDSLVLLEDTLGKDRSWLLAHGEHEIDDKKLAVLKKLLNRRTQHEPLAYVRGHTEFYGRTFVITPAVLEPRPESETMIELLKLLVQDGLLSNGEVEGLAIADVGTGSGALGITAALELPHSHVELLDIDENALAVTKSNVDKFTLNLPVRQSNLLMHSQQANDALLCNLPYVPDSYQINRAATHEPDLAIFGGHDGLDLYRKLFSQVADLPKQPLFILCESLPPQHTALSEIASRHSYKLYKASDFIQVFRHQN